MSSFFKVALDTTVPALKVAGGRSSADSSLLLLSLTLDDAVELRIWGDIQLGDPLNENFGTTKESANWIEATESLTVRIAAGSEGTFYIEARDAVWNLASLLRTFPEEGAPVVTPGQSSGGPSRPTEYKQLTRTAYLHPRSQRTRRVRVVRGAAGVLRTARNRGVDPAPRLQRRRGVALEVGRAVVLRGAHGRTTIARPRVTRARGSAHIGDSDEIEAMIALGFFSPGIVD